MPGACKKKEYRITAIGGGTGLSALLRGLKKHSNNLTAIVTVTDDGGGSGKIREEFGILPPGDMRNCILALANAEPIMEQLLQYRFRNGYLQGQNFGNLLIAAMTDMCDGFLDGLKELSNVLAVTGRVLPVSLDNITLRARLENGTVVEGESRIPKVQIEEKSPIEEVFLEPMGVRALPEAVDAIGRAQCVTIGPGSLYTSIIPNLLIPGISNAIRQSKATKIYIANIMTQPGESSGYDLEDHVNAITKHGGHGLIDTIVVNNQKPPFHMIEKYMEEESTPIFCDNKDRVQEMSLIEDELLDNSIGYIRHNSNKLAEQVIRIIQKNLKNTK